MTRHGFLVSQREDSITFRVRVIPRAKRTEIVGVLNGALKVKLAAPPVEGAANKALLQFLAEALGTRSRRIRITSGHKSREKTVQVDGISAEAAHNALLG